MDSEDNPFVPTAGVTPPELVGRESVLAAAKSELARAQRGKPSKALMLVGLRGVGKTVLLNKIQDAAAEKGLHHIFIEIDEDKKLAELLVQPLRGLLLKLDRSKQINDQMQKAWGALINFARSVKIKVENVEFQLATPGTADSGDIEADLLDTLVAVAEASAAAKSATVILLDEMQNLESQEFRAIIKCAHRLIQRQLPLIFLGAGLPPLRRLAGDSKEYSERLFHFMEIGALSEADAANALKLPFAKHEITYEIDALNSTLRATQGYPFFLQLWGARTWDIATGPIITLSNVELATEQARANLDQSFFRVRFDRLSSSERKYLRAMAEIRQPAPRAADIAAILNDDPTTLARVRGSLMRKGMIYSPTHGDTEFTVPLFDDFMRRTMQFETSIRVKPMNPIKDLLR